jgi:hypothetical protein
MSSPRPRPDLSSASPPERPPIWVNGQQRPSFDVRAYGAYSLIATRAVLGPALTRASASTHRLQARLLAGAFPINTERLGRAAAYLPTRSGIAATIGGIAVTVKDAAQVVSPPPPPEESLAAYDALWRARKAPSPGRLRGVDLEDVQSDPDLRALRDDLPRRPTRPIRPVLVHTSPAPAMPLPAMPLPVVEADPPVAKTLALEPEPEQATLLAIRSMLTDPGPDAEAMRPAIAQQRLDPFAPAIAASTPAQTKPRVRKPLPAWTKPILTAMRRAAAFTIAWTLIVLAMPIGLTKAAIAHFEGRDLRDLVEDP